MSKLDRETIRRQASLGRGIDSITETPAWTGTGEVVATKLRVR